MTDEDREILSEFRSRLPLDRLELETECCQQAIVYDDIGSWVADVKAQAKIAKEHISFVESELLLAIRKDPKEYGLPEKSTVDAVRSTVNIHERYRKAFLDYVEADRLASEASILLDSAQQRQSGLRDLVRLYVNNYYSQEQSGLDTSGWEQGEKAIMDTRRKRAETSTDLGEDNREE